VPGQRHHRSPLPRLGSASSPATASVPRLSAIASRRFRASVWRCHRPPPPCLGSAPPEAAALEAGSHAGGAAPMGRQAGRHLGVLLRGGGGWPVGRLRREGAWRGAPGTSRSGGGRPAVAAVDVWVSGNGGSREAKGEEGGREVGKERTAAVA
jgi:hypothetical protein